MIPTIRQLEKAKLRRQGKKSVVAGGEQGRAEQAEHGGLLGQ